VRRDGAGWFPSNSQEGMITKTCTTLGLQMRAFMSDRFCITRTFPRQGHAEGPDRPQRYTFILSYTSCSQPFSHFEEFDSTEWTRELIRSHVSLVKSSCTFSLISPSSALCERGSAKSVAYHHPYHHPLSSRPVSRLQASRCRCCGIAGLSRAPTAPPSDRLMGCLTAFV